MFAAGQSVCRLVVLAWGFAHQSAELYFEERGWGYTDSRRGGYNKGFLQYRSCFYHRNTARLSLALGSGRALQRSDMHYQTGEADADDAWIPSRRRGALLAAERLGGGPGVVLPDAGIVL